MKKNLMRILTLALAVLMLLSIAACGSSSSGSSSAPASSGGSAPAASGGSSTTGSSGIPDKPKQQLGPTGSASSGSSSSGGETAAAPADDWDTLNVALDQDGGSLNPAPTTSMAFGAIPVFYEPMWDITLDGDMIWLLAESCEKISDLEYHVKLREGVKFSNGNDFKANDVIFSIKYHKNDGGASGGPRVQTLDVDACYAIDDYNVCFILSDPYLNFYTTNAMMFVYDEESFNADTITTQPVGTGPYKLIEYVPNSSVKVERRDDYWGEQPDFKYINFYFLSETSQRVNALETGMVDIANVAIDDIEYVEGLPGYNIDEFYSSNYATISCNLGDTSVFYHNQMARKAFMIAIDRQAILNAVYYGRGYVMQAYIPPYWTDYEDRFNNATETYSRSGDVEYAKQLAEESGLAGQTVILITSGTADAIKCAEMIQSMEKAIGVNVEIQNYDAATVNQMTYAMDSVYDAGVGSTFGTNRLCADGFVNGVRYNNKSKAPGAWKDVEYYLELAPKSLCSYEPHGDIVYEVLTRYQEDACISYAICEYYRYTAVNDKLDINSVVRTLNSANAQPRFQLIKKAA